MSKPTINVQKLDGALGTVLKLPVRTAKFGVATQTPTLLSAITKVGTSPAGSVSGVPVDAYNFLLKIETSAADGVATFRWSTNGGVSFVETGKVIPLGGGAYVLGVTGVTFTFASGAYTANDTYAWTAVPIPVTEYSDPQAVKTDFVSGPLVEDACITLEEEGGSVVLSPVYPSIAGTSSAVTAIGTSPVLTLTGAANDNRRVVVTVVTGGARGTATVKVSLDNGNTYAAPVATAATVAIPGTGVTMNFATGTFNAGDSYMWTDFAPQFTNTDLANTFAAYLRKKIVCKLIEVITDAGGADDTAKATACAATAAAVETQAVTLENARLDCRILIHAPDVTDAALLAAFASVVAPHVLVAAGYVDVESAVTRRIDKRSAGFIVSAKFHGALLSVDIACPDPNEKGGGPLYARVVDILRDEDKTPGLDDGRFITLRTWTGKAGFFVTDPWSMADPTSDYALAQNGFVIDQVARTAYASMLNFSSRRLRTNRGTGPSDPTTGTIEETQAVSIEEKMASDVAKVLGKDIVGQPVVKIDRTINLIATHNMAADVRVQPYGYPKTITIRVGLTT